jgi:hypothetical protein
LDDGHLPAGDPFDRVVAAMTELGPARGREIAERADLTYRTTMTKLRTLARIGRAERLIEGTTVRWRMTRSAAGHPIPIEAAPDQPHDPTAPTATRDTQPQDLSEPDPPPAATVDARGERPATLAGEQAAVRPRRGKGQLPGEVLSVMRANPATTYKVSEMAALVDASPGATYQAMTKLVNVGSATLIAERPATFGLTSPPTPRNPIRP